MHRLVRIALFPLALAACAGEPTPVATDDVRTDEERRDDLWSALEGYDTWAQPGDWTGIQHQADGSPHGPYVQIWMNDVAVDGFEAGEFDEGAILVKALYDTDDPASEQGPLLVMEKQVGYGETDWFWAVFVDGEGTADPYGDVSMCTGCHAGGADYSLAVTSSPGTPSDM